MIQLEPTDDTNDDLMDLIQHKSCTTITKTLSPVIRSLKSNTQLKYDSLQNIITNAVTNVSKTSSLACYFLNFYCLHYFDNQNTLPYPINQSLCYTSMCLISGNENCGKKVPLLVELYKKHFKPLFPPAFIFPINQRNTQVFNYAARQLTTNYENYLHEGLNFHFANYISTLIFLNGSEIKLTKSECAERIAKRIFPKKIGTATVYLTNKRKRQSNETNTKDHVFDLIFSSVLTECFPNLNLQNDDKVEIDLNYLHYFIRKSYVRIDITKTFSLFPIMNVNVKHVVITKTIFENWKFTADDWQEFTRLSLPKNL